MASSMSLKGVSSRSVVATRPARASVVVRAEAVDRRALLGAFAAAAALVVPKADAITIPSQESTGGMLRGGGNTPKNGSAASMEGYSLEGYTGTKKPSYIAPGEKKALRAEARANAMKEAAKNKPATVAKVEKK